MHKLTLNIVSSIIHNIPAYEQQKMFRQFLSKRLLCQMQGHRSVPPLIIIFSLSSLSLYSLSLSLYIYIYINIVYNYIYIYPFLSLSLYLSISLSFSLSHPPSFSLSFSLSSSFRYISSHLLFYLSPTHTPLTFVFFSSHYLSPFFLQKKGSKSA